jgi:hypothetical protein
MIKIDLSDCLYVEDIEDISFFQKLYYYANLSLWKFLLNKDFNKEKLMMYSPKRIVVKAVSSELTYPEVKEKCNRIKNDFDYILVTIDLTTKIGYIEGFCSSVDLAQEKNKYKDSYVVSYRDLQDASSLRKN